MRSHGFVLLIAAFAVTLAVILGVGLTASIANRHVPDPVPTHSAPPRAVKASMPLIPPKLGVIR